MYFNRCKWEDCVSGGKEMKEEMMQILENEPIAKNTYAMPPGTA